MEHERNIREETVTCLERLDGNIPYGTGCSGSEQLTFGSFLSYMQGVAKLNFR